MIVETYYRGRTVAEAAARAGHPARHGQVPLLLRAAGAQAGPGRTGGDDMTCRRRRRPRRVRRRCAGPASGSASRSTWRECPACAAELAEFARCPALLARVDPADLAPVAVMPSPEMFARMSAAAAAAARAGPDLALVAAAVLAVLGVGVRSWAPGSTGADR